MTGIVSRRQSVLLKNAKTIASVLESHAQTLAVIVSLLCLSRQNIIYRAKKMVLGAMRCSFSKISILLSLTGDKVNIKNNNMPDQHKVNCY